MAADKEIKAAPAPGRVRGEWDPDVTYVRDDLVCVHHPNAVGEASADSWHICIKRCLGYHPELSADHAQYWEPSPWVNVTEDYTQPGYRYQRVHSIHPEIIDEYILGKGVPDWYYFDMLGFFGIRTKLLNVVDLLTTMRGTIIGAQSFLNLVNLNAETRRLAPEERYRFPGDASEPSASDYDAFEEYSKDISRETAWRNYLKGQNYWDVDIDDWKPIIKSARVWNDYTNYETDNLVYDNIYDGYKYAGCGLYRALRDINHDEPGTAKPSVRQDVWYEVCRYDILPMTPLRMLSETDNSRYELLIGQLAGQDAQKVGGRIMVTDPFWQQIYTCHLARLVEFLIPAWIRIEGGLYLLDELSIKGARHASSFNALLKPAFEGIEPHTLTVLPYIDDFGQVASVTEVFAVTEDGEEDTQGLVVAEKAFMGTLKGFYNHNWVPEGTLNELMLDGEIQGYYWREPYMPEQYDGAMMLKVRVPAFQKIRLKSSLAEEGSHYFWRWSLLNSYHHLPHFKVIGRRYRPRWMDLEPYTWRQLETKRWKDFDRRVVDSKYLACSQGDE